MYRPEGWEKLKKDIADESWMLPPQTEFPIVIPSGLEFQLMKSNLIEVGADAMLEGLINQPSNKGANVLYVDELADGSTMLHKPHRKGWLVFIPEEDKNE